MVSARLGRSADECSGLRKRVDLADPSEAAYAIRCDLPVGKTETLLVVDQFEELLTETAEAPRAPFVEFLMALVPAAGSGSYSRCAPTISTCADRWQTCSSI